MAAKKINVLALQPFSHGNVTAKQGGVYAMNPADAKELEKAGFVSLDAEGDPEQIQNDHQPQAKQPGDVVVDDADDLLGESKAEKDLDNKMASPPSNKARVGKK